jgi:hypothetical protein
MIDDVTRAYGQALYDTDRTRAGEIVHDALDQGVTREDVARTDLPVRWTDATLDSLEMVMLQAVTERAG